MLNVIIAIICVCINVLLLMQAEKAETASIMGIQNSNLFSNKKERGSEKVFTIATTVLVVIFFGLIILSKII